MGKREPMLTRSAVSSEVLDRRRRSLARKITLMTPETVRNSISETYAENLGLGREWRQKVGR